MATPSEIKTALEDAVEAMSNFNASLLDFVERGAAIEKYAKLAGLSHDDAVKAVHAEHQRKLRRIEERRTKT